MNIIIHKAIDTAGKPTPDLSITATEPLPEFDTLEESRLFFIREAQAIFEALSQSVCGGTLDHLMAIMLEKKASHFRITHSFVKE